MFQIPNIYKYKNLKLLIALPLVVVAIALLLSTQIVLDTSLSGGVSIILQTNTTLSQSALASKISSALHVQEPTIAASPGGVQITLSVNQSLANADTDLLSFYSYSGNYTKNLVNATSLGIIYQKEPTNTTITAALAKANQATNASLAQMRGSLQSELAALAPFGAVQSVNSSAGAGEMQSLAQSAYSGASAKYENITIAALHGVVDFSSYSYQQVTPTLGRFFLGELTNTIIIAFILIFITVLIIFRTVVPSFTVVFGAASDLIVALGAMGLFKIPLGIASIGGLLMLIGYSMDTDVMTAMRILRRGEGSPEDRAYSSMMTGITMTATAIVSFAVLFIISLVEYVPTYYEITGVVLMGLIGDVMTTWLLNATIILLYQKKRDGK